MSFAEGLVGVVLDERYRLDAVLGEGGMGAVFRATHLAMERKVAVKLLKPHLTSDEVQQQRFAREARSTMKVDSPHAVKVLDFGVTPLRDYYMVLEYLDGRTVQRELDVDGAFAPPRAVHIARQTLHALAAAHRSGLVHRDIKPDNLLLMRVGADGDYTKVLDFGVAKLMEGAMASDRSQLALTQQGMVFGTPEFMSPEQAVGTPLDGRSDLYALAATLYAMLTGVGMYEAVTAFDWLVAHVKQPAPHLADVKPELAAYPELDRVLQRCLAKSRDERPATAEEMDALLADVEPTLTRAPGDAPIVATEKPATLRKVTSMASSYVSSLTGNFDDYVATIQKSRRRSVALVVGGIAVVAAVVAFAATRGSAKANAVTREARDAAVVAVVDAGVMAAVVVMDAALPVAVVDAAVIAPDAPRTSTGTGTSTSTSTPKKPNEHLAAAEAAATAGNRLKQLAEADLALRADPRSGRAKYLLGDALIATGDLDRGCTYLKKLKKDRQAVARARSAGCATD